MRLPDPLAPYASLIKWGLITLLSAFLFVSGCNYGEGRNEQEVTKLQQNIQILMEANASWAQAAQERNQIIEDNVKEGEALQKQGKRGAADLAGDRKDMDKAIAEGQRKLERAIRDPKCNELLEMQVCSTVPLP